MQIKELLSLLLKAVLIALLIYIIITSLWEFKIQRIAKKIYDISKFDIKGKIDLEDDGILFFTNNPYHEGQQIKVVSNLQHADSIIRHTLTNFYASIQNSGPFYFIFYLGYIYPLRQILDLGQFVFYQGNKNIWISNLGKDLRVYVY